MLPVYHVLSPKHVMIHAVNSALSFCLNSFSMLRVNKPYCLHCCVSKYLNTDLFLGELSLAHYLRYLDSLQSRLTLCESPLFVSGHEGRQDNVVLLETQNILAPRQSNTSSPYCPPGGRQSGWLLTYQEIMVSAQDYVCYRLGDTDG